MAEQGAKPALAIKDKERDPSHNVPLKLVPLHIEPKLDSKEHKKPVPKPKPVIKKRIISRCSMDERLKHLDDFCNRTVTGDERPEHYKNTRYAQLIVDEKHKVIYCDIPNVLGLTWNTFLAKSTGKVKKDSPPVRNRKFMTKLGMRYLDSYADEDREVLLGEYFKFLVVRHPLERMELVWRQKFLESPLQENWRKKLGKQIILKHRGGFVNVSDVPSDATVRLEEFLEFAFADREMVDPGWYSYLQVCHTCEIRYDAILRSESIDAELDTVLRHYQDVDDPYSKLNYTAPSNPAVDILTGKNEFKQYHNVSVKAQEAVLRRFQQDMKMFGYSWNSQEKTGHCGISTSLGRVCC